MSIAPTVDIYDSFSEEILLFDDGIGVKKQKAHRRRRGNLGFKTEPEETRSKKPNPVMTESDSPAQKPKELRLFVNDCKLSVVKGLP